MKAEVLLSGERKLGQWLEGYVGLKEGSFGGSEVYACVDGDNGLRGFGEK